MKHFVKFIVFALVAVMLFAFTACGQDPADDTQATPRPTPKANTVDINAEQMNNYYVAYTVTKPGEMVLDENNQYVEKKDATNYVEVGYSSVVLNSEDGGESFSVGSSQCFSSTSAIENQPKSVFSVHMNYAKDQLENKGTETVAGKECTVYYFKSGPMEINMYVDESFGSTGICLKYVVTGYMPQTIEVTELSFGVINTEGYEFVNFQSKVATPAPAEEAPAA